MDACDNLPVPDEWEYLLERTEECGLFKQDRAHERAHAFALNASEEVQWAWGLKCIAR